jgi:outer membrane receptor protein involved in Fe transport
MERKREVIKLLGFVVLLAGALLMACPLPGMAADAAEEQAAQAPESEIQQLQDVTVKEKAGAPGIELEPTETIIEVDKFITVAPSDSILDVLKTQAAIDFRDQNDLDPGVDSVYLNGFDSTRFVTALDGLTIQKSGGRKSSNIVDYSMLPAFLIEKIEILPGPHSAMYDAKAIGGVLNFISRSPKRRDSLKPDVALSTGYSTYETWNTTVSLEGAVSAFTYDFGYQNYATDGYLRNSAMNKNIYYGRLGLVLPLDGFITLSASYSDVDRDAPVRNPAYDGSDYDPDYPIVINTSTSSVFDDRQKPTWDSVSNSYRLNYEQSLPIGRLSVVGYSGKDNRVRSYYDYTDSTRTTLETERSNMDTDWWQEGAKIMDEISWTPNHITTVGYDIAKMYDDGVNDFKTLRMNKQGYFLQHRWFIVPPLELKVGARYENMRFWYTDHSVPHEKHFDELMPKSFLTWKMDHVAPWLRDTSLSAGASKIWHAPDAHGTYNARGRPLGETILPEDGMGYDLILQRRLWRDIAFQIDYSFYQIDDYMSGGENLAGTVERNGVGVQMGGHLTEDLSFYASWSWQDLSYDGEDAGGHENVDQRAENRIGAGLRYALFENTLLLLDYAYQDDEINEIWDDADLDGDHEDDESVLTGYTEIPAYNVFDFGVQQTLFKKAGWFHEGVLSVYVKNLFDEEYSNAKGWPAIDRTYGASFRTKF